MKLKASHLALFALIALVATNAFAAGPFTSTTTAADDVKTIAKAGAAIIGGLVTIIGGALAAWKASHEEKFSTPLVCAIVGAAIAAVAAAA
jgi:hypothetical protein